ncbi:MAG TPA: hypothetical protein VGC77_12235 [Rhodopseudomonas sp.]|uniref:hypothetical protein n=1 Tax=Rhodopseudomonas sp. TaxID=1078 RepID=UPI002ED89822
MWIYICPSLKMVVWHGSLLRPFLFGPTTAEVFGNDATAAFICRQPEPVGLFSHLLGFLAQVYAFDRGDSLPNGAAYRQGDSSLLRRTFGGGFCRFRSRSDYPVAGRFVAFGRITLLLLLPHDEISPPNLVIVSNTTTYAHHIFN